MIMRLNVHVVIHHFSNSYQDSNICASSMAIKHTLSLYIFELRIMSPQESYINNVSGDMYNIEKLPVWIPV